MILTTNGERGGQFGLRWTRCFIPSLFYRLPHIQKLNHSQLINILLCMWIPAYSNIGSTGHRKALDFELTEQLHLDINIIFVTAMLESITKPGQSI